MLVLWGISHSYRAICCKMGYRRDVPLCAKGGIAPFWGATNLPEEVLRDIGYHSDGIAQSRDLGPLSPPPPRSL